MNRAEYQRLRRQLDEELCAGIDMLQAGYRAKVEALDALWEEPPSEEVPASEPELTAPSPPEPTVPAAEPKSARRLGAGRKYSPQRDAVSELVAERASEG